MLGGDYDPNVLDHITNDVESHMTTTSSKDDNKKRETNNEAQFFGIRDTSYYQNDDEKDTKNKQSFSETENDNILNTEQEETKYDNFLVGEQQQETQNGEEESDNLSLARFTNQLKKDINILKSKNENDINNFDWSNIKVRDDLYNAYDAKQAALNNDQAALNNDHANLLNHPDDSYVEYEDYEDFE